MKHTASTDIVIVKYGQIVTFFPFATLSFSLFPLFFRAVVVDYALIPILRDMIGSVDIKWWKLSLTKY